MSEFTTPVWLSGPPEQTRPPFALQDGALGLETLGQGWQGQRFCLPGLGIQSVQALAGQPYVSQGTQVQVMANALFAEHLVSSQPQCPFELLEEHFDIPAMLVDGHDVACLQF